MINSVMSMSCRTVLTTRITVVIRTRPTLTSNKWVIDSSTVEVARVWYVERKGGSNTLCFFQILCSMYNSIIIFGVFFYCIFFAATWTLLYFPWDAIVLLFINHEDDELLSCSQLRPHLQYRFLLPCCQRDDGKEYRSCCRLLGSHDCKHLRLNQKEDPMDKLWKDIRRLSNIGQSHRSYWLVSCH